MSEPTETKPAPNPAVTTVANEWERCGKCGFLALIHPDQNGVCSIWREGGVMTARELIDELEKLPEVDKALEVRWDTSDHSTVRRVKVRYQDDNGPIGGPLGPRFVSLMTRH